MPKFTPLVEASQFHFRKRPNQLAVCQNLVPQVNIKIAGKWMFIPLKMVLIGIDPYPVEFPLKIQKIQNEMVDVDGFSEGPKPFSFGQKLNVCLFQAEFQGHAALRQQSILQTIIT
jgi:hypothetical protein